MMFRYKKEFSMFQMASQYPKIINSAQYNELPAWDKRLYEIAPTKKAVPRKGLVDAVLKSYEKSEENLSKVVNQQQFD